MNLFQSCHAPSAMYPVNFQFTIYFTIFVTLYFLLFLRYLLFANQMQERISYSNWVQ